MANDAFSALAHPTRREIVERLSAGAATVGEATRGLGVSKPTISRHLKLLEEAGVVTRVVVGRNHQLALDPRTLAETADWIETQRARWERLFDVVGDYLEERKDAGMTEQPEFELRIERTFDASAEEVFHAWTSPEVLKRWFHSGSDWSTPTAEVDLRIGGRVRVAMREPDGTEHAMGGEYTEIDRPRRLAMTWTFDDWPEKQQLIEVEFTEHDGRTTVVLINSGIDTKGHREDQDQGWRDWLDQLERILATS
jgi:uncharacterized protein YndB with AHSA1/START domain/DNA-binding transcriptional ArsR family regulator